MDDVFVGRCGFVVLLVHFLWFHGGIVLGTFLCFPVLNFPRILSVIGCEMLKVHASTLDIQNIVKL